MTTLSSAAYRVGGEQGSESMPTAAAAAHRTLPPPYMMRHRLPPGWDIRVRWRKEGGAKVKYWIRNPLQGQESSTTLTSIRSRASGSSLRRRCCRRVALAHHLSRQRGLSARRKNSFGYRPHDQETAHVLHILKKHRGSRKPRSWRIDGEITTPVEEAMKELALIREEVMRQEPRGLAAMTKCFKDNARIESDCGTAKRGGDLGEIAHGRMQPSFEKVAFALSPGTLSPIIHTESGVHLILRLK
ncbi:hypothetical protein FOZ60_012798 [Perkinsus olseni]|uniref:Peptidyl-prolyl cis-trans isomerase n=1 Tax=Perkinsus olseni TaxID=32597 RepID=A0A7J6P932_PEROL|nr:hypothetical protein FOZ60_012798 [Perkinsus olseni]